HRFVEHDRAGRPLRVHLRGTGRKPMRSVILAMTLVLGLLPGTLAGSASAAPDTPITDAKSLAGEWRAVAGASPAGKVAVVAGKGSYRSTSSEATLTLSRDVGKEVLTCTRADLRGSAGLERVK